MEEDEVQTHTNIHYRTTFPTWILDLMKLKMLSQEMDDFFMGMIRSTVDYREKNNVFRRDFMHLLLQLKNKGRVTDDEDIRPDDHKDPNGHYLSFNEVAAQCFVFFIAGFETSSTATTFTLFELAQDQEIQDKLRDEIRTVLKKHNNEITYDGILEMTYLDQVLNESLRLHPPAASIGRVCNEDFKIPNTDVIIEKGIRVVIPTLAIHRDPDNYPNPDLFDPERFSEKNKANRHPMAHLPFGEGPRMCIGKMKMMFPTMVACTQGLNEMLKDHASIQDAVDIKDLIARFTTDIIGSAAFGIDCNSLQDPNSDFRQFGKQVFEVTFWKRLKRLISTNLPKWLLDLIRLKMVDQALEDFFMGIVRSTIKFREQNNVYRRDFLHLMLQLKNKGKVTEDKDFKPVDEGLETTRENDDNFLTFNEVAAQCFVFFIAGFETSSTTISFALLELSKNPEIQDKLREEIRSVLKKHNNEFTYDAIMEMKYLDKVVNETLRIHPPASAIARICNTDYKVPNTDLIIKNGIKILVPIIGIHTDPDHYPNPNVFDPERFNEENKAKRHQFAFIPFGEGPRMCIGSRFGLLQSKVGISSIIKDFAVSLHQKTKLPIKYSPKSIISAVEGDVWLTVQLVN
ncbi:hypothetical protein C4B38_000036 [Diabrotica virgifera virgifera]|nr:hypothetical protein C4B38_000036 [Diabrotica virgifera virgifera]